MTDQKIMCRFQKISEPWGHAFCFCKNWRKNALKEQVGVDPLLSVAYVATINRAIAVTAFDNDQTGSGEFLARIFRSDNHGLPNRAP